MPSGLWDANGWDGWLECAERFPGPLARWRRFGLRHTAMTSIVHHSQEGWFSDGPGSYHVFRDPKRFPTAWIGTITLPRDDAGNLDPAGKVRIVQHYPAFARLQTSSGANLAGGGWEMEGFSQRNPRTGKPDIITPQQIAAFRTVHLETKDRYPDLRLERNAAAKTGDDPIWGLVEHRQFPTRYGGTICPGERYAPLWAWYEEHGPPEHPKSEAPAGPSPADAAQARVDALNEGIAALVALRDG